MNLILAMSDTLINLSSLHWNLHADGCDGIQVMTWLATMIQRVDTSRALEAESGLIHAHEISLSRVMIYS